MRIAGVKAAPQKPRAERVTSGTAFLAAKKRVRDDAQARTSEALMAADDAFAALSRCRARQFDARRLTPR